MIEMSEFCIVYYDENYKQPTRKSGMKIAYEYAEKKGKIIINMKI